MSEPPPLNAGRKADGTFAPGYRANPSGKKPGTRHRATMLAEKLFSADATAIIKKVVEEAKNGQSWACKLVVERILPPARDRPSPLELPRMMSPADLPSALARVVDAMAEGALTPSEAAAIVTTLEAYGRASVFAGHEERLARLERRLAEEGDDAGGRERRIKAAEAHARRRRRATVLIDDPEDEGDLAQYRLPDWVADKLPTIELGRPSGLGGEPEDTRAWISRLTREALGEAR